LFFSKIFDCPRNILFQFFLLHIVDPPNYVTRPSHVNLPKILTRAAVLKHFPQCLACPFGNLTRAPLRNTVYGTRNPSSQPRPTMTNLPPVGSEFEIDLLGPWTDAEGRQVKSFSDCIYTMLCVCCGSNFA